MTYYVNKKLEIKGSTPHAGYQFKGSKEECEEYITNAKQKYTKEEMLQNERDWIETKGVKTIESIYGEEWNEKRKKYDESWDEIRRSKNKRNKK